MKAKILIALLLCFLFLCLQFNSVFATEIFSDGFESGDFSAWTGTSGTVEVVTSPVYDGSYSAKASETGYAGAAYSYYTHTSHLSKANCRGYFYLENLPDSTSKHITLIIFRDMEDYKDRVRVLVGFDGSNAKLKIEDGVNTAWGATAITTGKWHCIELEADYTTGTHKVYLNGTVEAQITGGVSGETVKYFKVGMADSYKGGDETYTVYYDCVVIADTYIGPEEEEGQTYNIDLSWQSNPSYTLDKKADFTVNPSWNFASAFNLVKQSIFNVDFQWQTITSWNLIVEQIVGAIQYIVDLTWQTATNWNEILKSSYNLIIPWETPIEWNIIQKLTYMIKLSWQTTSNWLLDIYHWIYSGVTQLVDLTWQTITQWITQITIMLPEEINWGIIALGFAMIAFVLVTTALTTKRD